MSALFPRNPHWRLFCWIALFHRQHGSIDIMAPPAGVPESVLKKRKRDDDWANKKAATAAEAQKKARESRKVIFKRAEAYTKEYRTKVRERPKWSPGVRGTASAYSNVHQHASTIRFMLQRRRPRLAR